MLNDWSIPAILLFAFVIVILIVSICAIGLILAEGEEPMKAVSRAISSVSGGGKGPEHFGLSILYYPLMWIGMLIVTSVLLAEVVSRKKF